jgi:hypothetical protein
VVAEYSLWDRFLIHRLSLLCGSAIPLQTGRTFIFVGLLLLDGGVLDLEVELIITWVLSWLQTDQISLP